MNVLSIPYHQTLQGESAFSASEMLDEITELHKIDRLNWPNHYSYRPETSFRIAHSREALYLKFIVNELNIRALYLNDQEPVWEDSCVEFFCMKPGQESYMNFEFNCIGTCVAKTRKGRELDVKPFSNSQMQQIDRFSTLDKTPFELKKGVSHWELTVKIPFALLNIDANDLPGFLRANFYKCGDGTLNPHYVSWSVISTENPDFHCPEYFGKLVF